MEVRELLSSLHVAQVDSSGEHAQHFSTLCQRLMSEFELHIFHHKEPAGPVARFQIGELELYWRSRQHTDYYAHCDEMKKRAGYWYMHKHGVAYRAGSFKGLEIACGNEDVFGGLLVRGLRRLGEADDRKEYIDGPSLCVDALITVSGADDVQMLGTALEQEGNEALFESRLMRLVPVDNLPPEEPRPIAILAAPRVGLALKSASVGRKLTDSKQKNVKEKEASSDAESPPVSFAGPSHWIMRRYRYVAAFGTTLSDAKILTVKGKALLITAAMDHAEEELGGRSNFVRMVSVPPSRLVTVDRQRGTGRTRVPTDTTERAEALAIRWFENRPLRDEELIGLYGMLEGMGRVGELPRSVQLGKEGEGDAAKKDERGSAFASVGMKRKGSDEDEDEENEEASLVKMAKRK